MTDRDYRPPEDSLWWKFRDRQMTLWPAARRMLGRGPLRCAATTTDRDGTEVRCELMGVHPRVLHDAHVGSDRLFWDSEST